MDESLCSTLLHECCSGIIVADADPMIVAVNACSGDLIELLQLLAADLADLAVGNLDLAIIA